MAPSLRREHKVSKQNKDTNGKTYHATSKTWKIVTFLKLHPVEYKLNSPIHAG